MKRPVVFTALSFFLAADQRYDFKVLHVAARTSREAEEILQSEGCIEMGAKVYLQRDVAQERCERRVEQYSAATRFDRPTVVEHQRWVACMTHPSYIDGDREEPAFRRIHAVSELALVV